MKITMKEKVLRFVESQGTATFTEIQRFIVDTKFGQGTYDANRYADETWVGGDWNNLKKRKCNPYRGYYSSAFCGNGYFFKGKDYLTQNGRNYSVVRN
jgi:hypothetical protein